MRSAIAQHDTNETPEIALRRTPSRPGPENVLAVLAWALAVLVAAPALPIYLTSSTAPDWERLSEDPTPWTAAVLVAAVVATGVASWGRRTPALRAARGVLLSGAVAAGIGVGFYGWYVYYLSSATLAEGAGAPAVGTVPPAIRVIDPTGEEWTLDRFRGRIVMLVFYRGHW